MRPQLQLQYKTENISWLTNDVIRVSDIFPPSPLELIWVVQVFVDMEYGWEDLILDDHDQDVETQLIFLSIVRLFPMYIWAYIQWSYFWSEKEDEYLWHFSRNNFLSYLMI